jgi:hypothetical protein
MSKLRDILINEGLMPKSAARPYRSQRDDIEEGYGDVPRDMQGRNLPTMRDLKKVKMVVIGPKGRYQEPDLTREGQRIFREITNGKQFDSWSTSRHHPALIWIAQNRPELFVGGFQLLPVPGGKYLIKNYDSMESLQTPETMDWTQI